MKHRKAGYALLHGHGLEIGAMNCPAQPPSRCTIDYCDVITREQAKALFPEVAQDIIVEPNYLCDLDTQGLQLFKDEQYDFVIMNHVIEHVANPIKVIAEVFRIIKNGGYAVISCPDKYFTFDKNRKITPLSHFISEFEQNSDTVTYEHYREAVSKISPEIMTLPEEQIMLHVDRLKSRRGHVHVWDSNSFKEFLTVSLYLIGEERSTCVYEVGGDETQIEYFAVWQRKRKGVRAPLSVIGEQRSSCVYGAGGDETQFEYSSVWQRKRRGVCSSLKGIIKAIRKIT